MKLRDYILDALAGLFHGILPKVPPPKTRVGKSVNVVWNIVAALVAIAILVKVALYLMQHFR